MKNAKSAALKKMQVKDDSKPWSFVHSTNESNGTKKKTLTESGAYHSKMMKGLSSAGWQAHSEAKSRARGEDR